MLKLQPKFYYYLLTSMYVAGIIGLSFPLSKPYFQAFTPLHLFAVSLYLIFTHWLLKPSLKMFLGLIIVGIMVEIIGVNTGLLFGKYVYDHTLGFEIFGVPPTIGLNWMIMVFTTFALVQNLFSKYHKIVQSILIAFFLIVFDYIAEPVAINLEMWHWLGDGIPPIYNYVCWFIISFLMSLVLLKNKVKYDLNSCFFVLMCQILFFVILRLKLLI